MTDAGAYCRRIESHLRRRNGGHPVRVAGPAFGRPADPTLHGPRLAWLRSRGPGR